jgi:predicted NBD/HSP70 family sugar kinase
LPLQARDGNRALVLQSLYRGGGLSRADLARLTGLTRVTISELVAELIADRLVGEVGTREQSGRGKPAILLDVDRAGTQVIGVDLSRYDRFTGAVVDLGGRIVRRIEVPVAKLNGEAALEAILDLVEQLLDAATGRVLGIGAATPGIVDSEGMIVTEIHVGWERLRLRDLLVERFELPVIVGNDADTAALAEFSFGGGADDMMLVLAGYGVGAGLVLGGAAHFGATFAAGEIGHVVAGDEGGRLCDCGKRGCVETWASERWIRVAIAEGMDREDVLRQAGRHLGVAIAPVLGVLNLSEIVIHGSPDLYQGTVLTTMEDTIRERVHEATFRATTIRLSKLGDDIVLRGTAVLLISETLGVV